MKELPLAGLMLRCSKNSSIARSVAEAAVVVQVPLNLAACGVDDVVKQHHAVCLEDLPWEAAAGDEIWSVVTGHDESSSHLHKDRTLLGLHRKAVRAQQVTLEQRQHTATVECAAKCLPSP